MTNKKITPLASILAIVIFVVGFSACEQLQQISNPQCPRKPARMAPEPSMSVFTPISHL